VAAEVLAVAMAIAMAAAETMRKTEHTMTI
jgi:hypothetical protein